MYRQLRLFFIIPITILSVCLPSACLYAQNQDKIAGAEPFEFWVDHLPYNTFKYTAALDDYVFAASSNNVLVVNSNSDEISRYSRINGLTGIEHHGAKGRRRLRHRMDWLRQRTLRHLDLTGHLLYRSDRRDPFVHWAQAH